MRGVVLSKVLLLYRVTCIEIHSDILRPFDALRSPQALEEIALSYVWMANSAYNGGGPALSRLLFCKKQASLKCAVHLSLAFKLEKVLG